MTKEQAKLLSKDINEAIDVIAKKHNLTVGKLTNTYSDEGSRISISFNDAKDAEYERNSFKKHCFAYGFKPEDYGKTVKSKGAEYTFVGFELSRPKFACRCKGANGDVLFSTEAMARLIQTAGN